MLALSIRNKLYLAFGGVALLAVVSTVIGLVQLDNISQKQRSISEESLPAVMKFQELKITSLRFINGSLALSKLNDQASIEAQVKRIEQEGLELETILASFSDKASSSELITEAKTLVEELKVQLHEQSANVLAGVELKDQRAQLMQEAETIASDLEKKLEPISNQITLSLAELQMDKMGEQFGDSLDVYLDAVDAGLPVEELEKALDIFIDSTYENLDKFSVLDIRKISTYLDIRLGISQVLGALR
jgi:hypothetical protein